METIAAWAASAATMIAAMMTAANLGARVTGWGFVIFSVGSVCWSVVGATSGQTSLLATNIFLTLVNAVGIWRWLGRQKQYEDGGRAAKAASRRADTPTLFTATAVAGMPGEDRHGEPIGKAVEALLECSSGAVSYVVFASGGVGGIEETLRAVPRENISFQCDRLAIDLTRDEFCALPSLNAGAWPAQVEAIQA